LRLDGDATFAFQFHFIKVLVFFLAVADHAGEFENAVGQGRLAMVDMGDDAEITYIFYFAHNAFWGSAFFAGHTERPVGDGVSEQSCKGFGCGCLIYMVAGRGLKQSGLQPRRGKERK